MDPRRVLKGFNDCAGFRALGWGHAWTPIQVPAARRFTAKLAGLEPAAYLREAARRAIITPGTVTLPRDLVTA